MHFQVQLEVVVNSQNIQTLRHSIINQVHASGWTLLVLLVLLVFSNELIVNMMSDIKLAVTYIRYVQQHDIIFPSLNLFNKINTSCEYQVQLLLVDIM